MLVDSHCHLEYEGLIEDQAGALDRAREAGVQSFLNISTKQAEWAQVVGTARATPDVYASVGSHPHNADDAAVEPLADGRRHDQVQLLRRPPRNQKLMPRPPRSLLSRRRMREGRQ